MRFSTSEWGISFQQKQKQANSVRGREWWCVEAEASDQVQWLASIVCGWFGLGRRKRGGRWGHSRNDINDVGDEETI